MPSKKKKYNARFPAGRIKKIMQTDEEVGKVAQAVPVIISRTLELFVESLLTKSIQITQARNAKTLTPSHMKQCILSEHRFDFLKDLVKNIPDASAQDDNDNHASDSAETYATYRSPSQNEPLRQNSSLHQENRGLERRHSQQHSSSTQQEIVANFYTEQASSSGRTPVIQYSPKITTSDIPKSSFESAKVEVTTPRASKITYDASKLASKISYEPQPHTSSEQPKLQIDLSKVENFSMGIPIPQLVPSSDKSKPCTITSGASVIASNDNIPPLVPLTNNSFYSQSASDNLLIDEDYDN